MLSRRLPGYWQSALADSLASGRFAPPRASSDAASGVDRVAGVERSEPPEAETARAPQAAISTERSTKSPAYFRSIAEIGAQVAEALDHAHENGVPALHDGQAHE